VAVTLEELKAVLITIEAAPTSQIPMLWTRFMPGARPAHSMICRHTMGWELQARVYGGLSAATRRRIRDLTRAFERDPDYRPPGVAPLKPGTEFRRYWKGRNHQVRVTMEGFLYENKTYTSLSVIARKITGTQWSGPEFFGTRPRIGWSTK
jgi:hypothetical protein